MLVKEVYSPILNDLHGRRKKSAIVCDLDGTLASCEWRRHHVEIKYNNDGSIDRHKNWPAFFDGIPQDSPVPRIVQLLNTYRRSGFQIVLVSARPDSYRYHTEWWLMEHDIQYDYLFMRDATDHRRDYIVKEEIYKVSLLPRFHIYLVIDDRPSVVEFWKSNLLPVEQVYDPNLPPILRKEYD